MLRSIKWWWDFLCCCCSLILICFDLQGDTCCWSCDRCDPWEYVENEFKCADCGPGRWPYDDKRGCFDLEMQYMRWDSLLAIVPICVACGGILLTVTVIAIFIRHSETPIVKVFIPKFFLKYIKQALNVDSPIKDT